MRESGCLKVVHLVNTAKNKQKLFLFYSDFLSLIPVFIVENSTILHTGVNGLPGCRKHDAEQRQPLLRRLMALTGPNQCELDA